jgi:peptidoglycan hydrolase CwlO-like protein
MNIFNIAKANAQCKELEKDKLTLVGQLEVAQKDLADAQNVIGNFMKEKEGMDKTIADLKAEHATAIAALEGTHKVETDNLQKSVKETSNKVVEAEGKTAAKAAALVASLGVEPETVKKSNDELLASGVKKSRFTFISHTDDYKKNKQVPAGA